MHFIHQEIGSMAWETRKGTSNVYYTRSYRSDGELVREYLGNGPLGREADRQCEEIRELRDRRRRDEAITLARFAAAERACDEYCRFVELALHAYMAECGYHYHRGEWRKRRVPKIKPAEEQPSNDDAIANGSSLERSQPERSRQEPEPRRRSMPKHRPLDCRLGLVRGNVVFRSAKACTFAERKTTMGTRPLRLSSTVTGRALRSCPRRSANVGRNQLPRPPPAQLSTAGKDSSGTQFDMACCHRAVVT